MSRNEVIKQLTDIIKEVLDLKQLFLSDDMMFEEIEDWDSLQNIQIFVAIEEEMNVRINVNETAEISTIGMLVNLIMEKMK